MARASYRLHALFLLSCFCSMSSMHLHVAASLCLDVLHVTRPGAILVFPGDASIGDGRRIAEPHGSTGRVSQYSKEVWLWGNQTGGTANLTTNFSLQIIQYQNSSSYFAWTMPHVYGQSLGLLPFPADTTANWNGDHRSVAVELNTYFNRETDALGSDSELIGMDVNSMEYTETTSPSKNLSSVLLLPRVSYLPSHATARSFDCSGSLGINTTELCSPVFFVFQEQQTAVDFSVGKLKYLNLTDARICAVAGLVLCCIRVKRPLQSTAATEPEDDGEQIIRGPGLRRGLGPRQFPYCELAAATDNFAEERKIGRGGFGPVYRGCLTDQDRHVAIKVLSQELSVQGLKEFQAEVTILSQLRHRNIVRLVGWCGRRRELALVYELVPGGSLDTHLYNPDRHLTWPQRYKIALQLGSALRYLHTECDQCVVHGDIKPANVMLDASGNAKLGDFGLARLVDHGVEPQTTQVVAGTVGYIDPEFVSSRRPSAESDVYSFGVVLLEIACGRRPTPSRRSDQAASAALLASVRDMYRRNVILDAADRRLDGEFDGMQMERLLVTGLWCAHHDPLQRPSIAQALDVLRSEDAELPVLVMMGDSGEIRGLEEQAYGDLSDKSSAYLDESDETAYLTTEDSAYLLQM
ncbi:L-type lectin-domain containing receptor kinase IX.1-like [Lolium rigidum]|uniref:L-type lectin-domain containing receptor kinase IX.1-like n=1 Tax=Lolium rigidum TaxID=89674 RepID=UPI001F5D0C5D|nr:L-type lectin-domain containing receptor kinase IX.1-like [Lolium rigidum]